MGLYHCAGVYLALAGSYRALRQFVCALENLDVVDLPDCPVFRAANQWTQRER